MILPISSPLEAQQEPLVGQGGVADRWVASSFTQGEMGWVDHKAAKTGGGSVGGGGSNPAIQCPPSRAPRALPSLLMPRYISGCNYAHTANWGGLGQSSLPKAPLGVQVHKGSSNLRLSFSATYIDICAHNTHPVKIMNNSGRITVRKLGDRNINDGDVVVLPDICFFSNGQEVRLWRVILSVFSHIAHLPAEDVALKKRIGRKQ